MVIFLLTLSACTLLLYRNWLYSSYLPKAFEVMIAVKIFNTLSHLKAFLGMPAHFFYPLIFSIYETFHYFPQRLQWASKELWLLQEPMSQNGLSFHWVTERSFVLNSSAYEQPFGNRFAGRGRGLKISAVMIGCMLACPVRKSS